MRKRCSYQARQLAKKATAFCATWTTMTSGLMIPSRAEDMVPGSKILGIKTSGWSSLDIRSDGSIAESKWSIVLVVEFLLLKWAPPSNVKKIVSSATWLYEFCKLLTKQLFSITCLDWGNNWWWIGNGRNRRDSVWKPWFELKQFFLIWAKLQNTRKMISRSNPSQSSLST